MTAAISKLRFVIGAALLAIGLCNSAWAQRLDSAVAIGQGSHIWSKTLQEERHLLIHLPPGYWHSDERYPVLFLLDAEAQFHHATGIVNFLGTDNGRIPEMIVVGVTNTNRTRDLTPATQDAEQRKDHPNAGGADAFLTFLADELRPWVNANYRTQPYRILVGHSLGGLFAVHSLLRRPDSFQPISRVSPSPGGTSAPRWPTPKRTSVACRPAAISCA